MSSAGVHCALPPTKFSPLAAGSLGVEGGCSALRRSPCIGSYMPYSGVPPSDCAQGGYAVVRGGGEGMP